MEELHDNHGHHDNHHHHHPGHHDNRHHLVVKQCDEGPSQSVGGGGAERQVGEVGLHCTQYKTARLRIIMVMMVMMMMTMTMTMTMRMTMMVMMRRMEEDNAPGLDESEQKDKRGGNPSHYEHTTPFSENVAKIQKKLPKRFRQNLESH